MKQVVQYWLSQLCKSIPDAKQAAVCFNSPDTGTSSAVAWWLEGAVDHSDLDAGTEVVLAESKGPLLELRFRHEQGLQRRLCRRIRGLAGRIFGPGYPVQKAVLAGAILCLTSLCLIRGDHRVTGTAPLEASAQRLAVTPWDGFVRPDQGEGESGREDSHGGTGCDSMKTTVGRLFDFLALSAANAGTDVIPGEDQLSDCLRTVDNDCREVEVMGREMEESFRQSDKASRLRVYTASDTSFTLSAGIARCLFSSGSLLAGFLATLLLRKGFDPVAVLSSPKNPKIAGAAPSSVKLETGRFHADYKAETMFAARGRG